jgi:hypothetical protein
MKGTHPVGFVGYVGETDGNTCLVTTIKNDYSEVCNWYLFTDLELVEETLQVGDRVRMSQSGKGTYKNRDDNPWDAVGTVYDVERFFLPIGVNWDNGTTNSYEEEHLELVTEEDTMEISLSYTITDTAAAVFFNGKMYTVPATESNYSALVDYLRAGEYTEEGIEDLLDKPKMISRKSEGLVEVIGSTVYYKGDPVYSVLANRLVELMDQGFDVTRWKLFMENMMENPSYKSRQALYSFLDVYNTPITEDGHFLAFKRVRGDFFDLHSGTFDNSPGQIVKMPRSQVDDDSNRTCSAGLHACASSYLGSFYANSSDAKVVVVKINPRDVVAVPSDYEFSKMRVCRYEVLGEAQESDVESIQSSIATDWTSVVA